MEGGSGPQLNQDELGPELLDATFLRGCPGPGTDQHPGGIGA